MGLEELPPPSAEPPPQMVFVVICVEPGELDIIHIFSTMEKAQAFADADPRGCVLYDYLLDAPERHEGRAQ